MPYMDNAIKRVKTDLLSVGDVIEVSANFEWLNLPDDLDDINFDDYPGEYSVSYKVQGKNIYTSYNFEVEPGVGFGDIVSDFIEDDLPKIFEELLDYEVFDVDNSNGAFLSAKVRVKSVFSKLI